MNYFKYLVACAALFDLCLFLKLVQAWVHRTYSILLGVRLVVVSWRWLEVLEEKLSYSDYVGLKPVEDSAIPPTGLEPCKRREKKSNDLCQIPKYRISKISKKNLRECVCSSSVSLSKLSRGNTIFLSWKYAGQSGQANTLLFYINLLIKSIMVWRIHISSLSL